MIKKSIFLHLFVFSFLLFPQDSFLRFSSFEYPEEIEIPKKIDYKKYSFDCKIKYFYWGDWIGGYSVIKYCMGSLLYDVNAIYYYYDDEGSKLLELKIPDVYCETLSAPGDMMFITSGSDGFDNFLFKERKEYSVSISPLSYILFKIKKLQKLIKKKKIKKIEVVVDNVSIDWDYSCTDQSKNETGKELKGKFEFDVEKKFEIKVRYEN